MSRVVVAAIVVLGSVMAGAAAQLPRSVLILDQSDGDSVWFDAFFSGFQSTLRTKSAARVSIYSEHLDLRRFGGARHSEHMRSYLRDKFSERPIGVVVAQGSGALEFVLRSRAELWPGVPVIFAAVDEETGKRLSLPPGVTGTLYRRSFRNAVATARVLVPNLKRIALVGDPFERQAVRSNYKQEVPLFASEFEVIDLMGLSMAELRRRVATLPPDTAIVYTAINIDGAGVAYRPYEALATFAEVANRPIVVDVETNMGYGGAGGFVMTPVPIGEAAARLALRILDGEDASKMPVTTGDFTRPVFDWRQLQRFGISESRLPPGSEIRFRAPSMWEQYHWYIITALAIIAVQVLLIFGLLLHRARRLRAEAELRESQEFMELSTNAGELGLWVRDLERGDLWANQRLRSLFGFGQNDVLRFDDVLARIHPDDRSQVVSLVKHAQEDGLPFEADFRVLSNGTERWIAAKGRSVGNAPDGAMRRMGALTDITTRKNAELEAQRHRDELAHVSRVSMMGQLASALAHELNQPLGAILRNAEAAELFLQTSPPDLQEVCAILADIRKDDQRAGEVIDHMRALLKRRESQWSEVDLNAVAEEVADLLRFDAEARRVKLALELSRSVSHVRGDRVQLQQVLLNLILNAMDAMNGCESGGHRVAVCVSPREEEIEVAVSDSGHGILADNVKRLFEPFFTTKPSGMGLGLAISHTIIQAHGGRLWAENNPDCGATFYFTLPVSDERRHPTDRHD